MDELDKIDTSVRRISLGDLALQDDCLLVYCAVAWLTCVLMCIRAITVSSKSRLGQVCN